MNYTLDQATEIPINILKHCIKSEIRQLSPASGLEFDLDLSMFFFHYTATITLEELSTAKDTQQVFQSKWIDLINQLHEDLATGRDIRLNREKENVSES